jgi:hypothetical protein
MFLLDKTVFPPSGPQPVPLSNLLAVWLYLKYRDTLVAVMGHGLSAMNKHSIGFYLF